VKWIRGRKYEWMSYLNHHRTSAKDCKVGCTYSRCSDLVGMLGPYSGSCTSDERWMTRDEYENADRA
jgi:hypothetical protein